MRTWLAKKCDVILIDETLLKWHMKQLVTTFRLHGREIDTKVDYHPFPGDNEIWFHVGFRDRALRDRFNQVLAEIRKDGTYDRIREDFVSLY